MGEEKSVATVIPLAELRRSATAALFEGGDLIGVPHPFVTEYERGQGPALHLHPYPEAFVVETGTATFTVGEGEQTVEAGHVLVVPAETVHGFKCADDDTLRGSQRAPGAEDRTDGRLALPRPSRSPRSPRRRTVAGPPPAPHPPAR